MIKVIFFDLGEVVLTNDWHYNCPEKFTAFSEYYNITYDQMEKGWKAAWPLYEIGQISEDKFWKIFLKTAGASKINIKKAKIFWRKYFDSKPKMFSILKKLKKNYILAVLSATGKEWLDYKIKRYKLDNYFSSYVTTFNTGFKKIDKKIYKIALTNLKIKPKEALFIDDTEKVIKTAQSIRINTILFKSVNQLLAKFSELNIII